MKYILFIWLLDDPSTSMHATEIYDSVDSCETSWYIASVVFKEVDWRDWGHICMRIK